MEVICDFCGKKFNFNGGNVHFNRSKKHFCSRKCQADAQVKHGLASKIRNNGRQDERYQLWCQAKRRAKKKNLEFDLKPEDIIEIPKICPVLGIPIFVGDGKLTDNSPTVERIDNNKGYTKENVIIISYKANRIKNNATLEELKKVVRFYEKIQNTD
jgi:hypothetical protein